MQHKEQDLSTIPTRDLIWNILGDNQNGLSCAQITPATALVLEHKLQGSRLWKVEYSNVDGSRMEYPMLWRYQDWASANSTYKKQKEYSRMRVLDHNLTTANVNMLAKAIMKKSPIPEQAAQAMEYNIIKSSGNMPVVQFFGVVKLKTEEKDLE
jgi:hypothetical protein